MIDQCVVPVTLAILGLVGLTGCAGSPAAGSTTVTRNEEIAHPVTVSVDRRTLTVMAESGGCDSVPRLHVTETPETLSLTVRVTTRTGPDVVCPADARMGPARVTLRKPLGSRTVTDATTGHRLPIRESRSVVTRQKQEETGKFSAFPQK